MHPYYTSGQHASQQGHYQHSLSSTTDVSAHYQLPQGAGYSSAPDSQQVVYHHGSAQYAVHPSLAPGQVTAGQSSDQRNAYSGQTLRTLPFSNTYNAGVSEHGSGTYGGIQASARTAYPEQYATMSSQAPYPQSAAYHSPQQSTRYIPTPAQTMQTYQTLSPRSSHSTPPKSTPSPGAERYACDRCDRTFSRPHDRKRHFESQHLQTSHSCQYCRKEFSRADSLKRHLDNGCDKMPVS